MLSSMYSGVSGLSAHQTKLDVIGNNIANVNTTAYKKGRTSFKEVFSQMLSSAQPPTKDGTAGTNPSQVGLGTSVASITTIHKRGNIQRTDNPNDLAIKGDGFFIVSDGINRRYTRAGNFIIDGDGNLATVNGEKVLGWNIGTGSSVDTSKPLKAIDLSNLNMSANATDRLVFEGNIDSNTGIFVPEVEATGEIGNFSEVTESVSETCGEWRLSLSDKLADGESITIGGVVINAVDTATYDGTNINEDHDLAGQLADIKTVLDNDAAFSAHYLVDIDGTELVITEKAGEATGTELNSSISAAATLTQLETTTSVEGTDGEYTFDITENFKAGETITIGGEVYTAVYSGATDNEFNIGSDIDTTTANLVDVINANTYCDYTAVATGTQIALTEKVPSGTDITLDDIVLGLETPILEENPIYYNMTIYDSLGDSHTITAKFMKTASNTYDYTLITEDPAISSLKSDVGTIKFTNDGKLDTTSSGTKTKSIEIEFNNGAKDIKISATDVVFDEEKFTQYSNDTKISGSQEGYSSGSLDNLSIDSQGNIVGRFTNGEENLIATIALASFTNPEGLEKVGDNLFTSTWNSGDPDIGIAGTAERGKIESNSLEMSNVDLSKEFTEMIVAQRGFQANSRIITTSDEILQELVNLKR